MTDPFEMMARAYVTLSLGAGLAIAISGCSGPPPAAEAVRIVAPAGTARHASPSLQARPAPAPSAEPRAAQLPYLELEPIANEVDSAWAIGATVLVSFSPSVGEEGSWHHRLGVVSPLGLTERPKLAKALGLGQFASLERVLGDWPKQVWAVMRVDLVSSLRLEVYRIDPRDDSVQLLGKRVGSYQLKVDAAPWRPGGQLFLLHDPLDSGQTAPRFVAGGRAAAPRFPRLERREADDCPSRYQVCGFTASERGRILVAGLHCDRQPSLLTWEPGQVLPRELLFASISGQVGCAESPWVEDSDARVVMRWRGPTGARVVVIEGDSWREEASAAPFAPLPSNTNFDLLNGRVRAWTHNGWQELDLRTPTGPLAPGVDKLFLPPGELPLLLAGHTLYRSRGAPRSDRQ